MGILDGNNNPPRSLSDLLRPGLIGRHLTPAPTPLSSIASLYEKYGLGGPWQGRTAGAQASHDGIVLRLHDVLVRNNFNAVMADLRGHAQPWKISWTKTGEGHIPDVTAWDQLTQHIFEVETDDSIASQHTREQWTLFSTFAREHRGRFIVVVPTGSKLKAQLQLLAWGIAGEVWAAG